MTKPQRPYSRVYWEAIDDPKFASVWDDDAALSCWLRLLLAADMAWPASAALYHGIKARPFGVLVDAGLVDPQAGSRFRIHGLDAERAARSRGGSLGADGRWHNDEPPHPGGTLPGPRKGPSGTLPGPAREPARMPSQDEPSKDETSYPLTPAERGNGSPRTNGTNPRAVAAREAEASRDRSRKRQAAYLRGDITESELRELRAADAVPVPKGVA